MIIIIIFRYYVPSSAALVIVMGRRRHEDRGARTRGLREQRRMIVVVRVAIRGFDYSTGIPIRRYSP